MNTAIENKLVERYFRLMQNWDNESKKSLIIKLTQSIDSESKNLNDFSNCFGAWEDSRTADEIIKDLKADRFDNRDIEEF